MPKSALFYEIICGLGLGVKAILAPAGLSGPPAAAPASPDFGRLRLNLPFFKRLTPNRRIFIDTEYKRSILYQ
jgi:hypothetical protein